MSDLDRMQIRQGARLNFTVEQADPESISATFLARNGDVYITDTVAYADGVAEFQFDSPDTDEVGVYEYQISENFETGSPDIYPNFDNCDGDCDFPTLEICESIVEGS